MTCQCNSPYLMRSDGKSVHCGVCEKVFDYQAWLVRIFPLKKHEKTTMITLLKCPKCKSLETSRCHHYGNFALPECFFQRCDDCGHQWDHS